MESVNIPSDADPQAYLDELRRRDGRCEVFGSGKHRYKSTRINRTELQDLESRIEVRFPDEYREHLMTIGHGVGPYYGIENPDIWISHLLAGLESYKEEENKVVSPSQNFSISSSDLANADRSPHNKFFGPLIEGSWPSGGCICVADQGCAGYAVLILTGEFRGRVFDMQDEGGYDATWAPARRPPGRIVYGESHLRVELEPLNQPPTFKEWYVGWLEQGLSDLSAFQ